MMGHRNGGMCGLESNSIAVIVTKPETGTRIAAAMTVHAGMSPLAQAMIASTASRSHRTMISIAPNAWA